jgi:hypothetical protein
MNKDFKRPFLPTINLSQSRRIVSCHLEQQSVDENSPLAGMVRAVHALGAADFAAPWPFARARGERDPRRDRKPVLSDGSSRLE